MDERISPTTLPITLMSLEMIGLVRLVFGLQSYGIFFVVKTFYGGFTVQHGDDYISVSGVFPAC